MKKYLLALAALSLFPLFAWAAYGDVSLTTDARIGLTGETLNVSGATAYVQSIDVTSDSFTATLVPGSGGGSSLKVSSPSLYKITHNVTPQSAYVDAEICNGSESSVTFGALSGATIQVTVQVNTASTCSGGSSGSSGGSSSGGGGGGAPPAPPAPPPPIPPPTPPTTPPSVTPIFFTKLLSLGQSSSEVVMLQKVLNADPETRIAITGSGSPGQETKFFGPLTKKSLGKFQLKHDVVANDQDPGFGIFGPKTRTKINEVAQKLGVGSQAPVDNQAKIEALKVELARLLVVLQQMLAAQGH